MRTGFIFTILVLCLMNCRKDDPAPLPVEVSGKLLAGERGKSKSFQIKMTATITQGSTAVTSTYFFNFVKA